MSFAGLPPFGGAGVLGRLMKSGQRRKKEGVTRNHGFPYRKEGRDSLPGSTVVDLVNELQERHVHFKSLTDGIDTKTPAGRFFFHVMASLAQMERELIIERTHAGLEAAKRQGRVGGRKRRMTEGKVKAARKLLSSGTPPRDVAQSLGVSVPTLYRWVPASTRM